MGVHPGLFGTRIFKINQQACPVIDSAELLEQVTSARLIQKIDLVYKSGTHQSRGSLFPFLSNTFSDKIVVKGKYPVYLAPKVTNIGASLPAAVRLDEINNIATVKTKEFPKLINLSQGDCHLQMRDKSNSSDLYQCIKQEKVLEGYECKSGKQVITFGSLHEHLIKLNAPEGWKSIMIMVAMTLSNSLKEMCSKGGSMLFVEGTYYKANYNKQKVLLVAGAPNTRQESYDDVDEEITEQRIKRRKEHRSNKTKVHDDGEASEPNHDQDEGKKTKVEKASASKSRRTKKKKSNSDTKDDQSVTFLSLIQPNGDIVKLSPKTTKTRSATSLKVNERDYIAHGHVNLNGFDITTEDEPVMVIPKDSQIVVLGSLAIKEFLGEADYQDIERFGSVEQYDKKMGYIGDISQRTDFDFIINRSQSADRKRGRDEYGEPSEFESKRIKRKSHNGVLNLIN
ncbi:dtxR [Acrasis kona]|uniref:DtxR n=1 Tax=Acrasis kona TaxID=1008807 RepID=A0AAW2ZTI8_9EUKA